MRASSVRPEPTRTRYAQDLALVCVERTLDDPFAVANIADAQGQVAAPRRAMGLLVEGRQVATYHHRNQALGRQFVLRESPNVFAVAEHGNPIRKAVDFLHPVADVDDRNALRLESGDDFKESIRLARGQRCRRFIHDDDAGVGSERAGDFDNLALAKGQRRNAIGRAERGRRSSGGSSWSAPDRPVVHDPDASRFDAQEYVLCDRQIWCQGEFLVDDRNSAGA